MTFSQYVRASLDGSLTDEQTAVALQELRKLITRWIKRRNLLGHNPRWLGVDGFKDWGFELDAAESSAIGDLANDCFVELLIEKHTYLAEKLEESNDIEGLVVTGVNWFLHDRQVKAGGPNSRRYEITKKIIEDLAKSKRISSPSANEIIRRTTVLKMQDNNHRLDVAAILRFIKEHAGWDEVLPLRNDASLLEDQSQAMISLLGQGNIVVGVLLDAVKDLEENMYGTASPSQAAPLGDADDEVEGDLRTSSHEYGYDSMEHIADCLEKVINQVDQLPRRQKVRERIKSIVVFIREQIAAGNEVPKQADIVRHFSLSKSIVSEDYNQIRALWPPN